MHVQYEVVFFSVYLDVRYPLEVNISTRHIHISMQEVLTEAFSLTTS